MQGRVLPESINKLQIFPKTWQEELFYIKKIGFNYVELLDDKEEQLLSILENKNINILAEIHKNKLEYQSVCMDRLCNYSLLKNESLFLKKLEKLVNKFKKCKNFIFVIPFFDKNKISNKEELNSALKILAKYDNLLLENKFSLEIDLSAEIIKKEFDKFNFKNIGICYDLGNNIGKGVKLKEEIKILGNYINHIHIKDKIAGKNVRIRRNLEQLDDAFSALKEISFSGLMILETCISPNPLKEAEYNLFTIKEYINNKKMKILFIGLGSIGQRHLQNIKRLQKKKIIKENIQLFALVKNVDIHRVIKNGKCFKVKDIGRHYNIKTTESLEEAKKIKPDVVFVVNPTSLHVKTALEFGQQSSDLFIEKPLGHSLEKIDELQKIINKKKLISMVGYQTRFNPLIKNIKQIIKKNSKKIITASFEWNTFLPLHHCYEDYSKGYAARKELGGGVVMGLIHEIDLIYYLLGEPAKVFAFGGKFSDLKMNVEDTIMSIWEYEIKYKRFPVYLNLSYAQTKEIRKFKIQFTDSTLFVNLMENKYEIFDKEGTLIEKKRDETKRNDLFIKEISYFLDCVKKREDSFINVKEGRKSLELALKIKESIKIKKWVIFKH